MCEPEELSIGCLVTASVRGEQLIGRVLFRIISSGTVVIKASDPKNPDVGTIVEVPEDKVRRIRHG